MSDTEFKYDVFLSHSAADKDTVREIANRLKSDGVQVWFAPWEIDSDAPLARERERKQAIEDGLEHSRVLVLCLSAEALAADWPQLESHTFRFKDPLNHNRRFIPLRLDDAPTKGSLAQFSYIDWRPQQREQEYSKLLEAGHSRSGEPQHQRGYGVKKITHFASKASQINSYSFSPDGKFSVTGANDNTVRLWDMSDGACLRTFKGHSQPVWNVALSQDRSKVLSGADDHTVRLWDVETGQCLHVFTGHTSYITRVIWSNDERLILTSGCDQTARVWDVETGQCRLILEGHARNVWSAAWSPDQQRVLTGSKDKTVRLWEIETGRCLREFKGHSKTVWSVSWSPDQAFALTGSKDRSVRLWDIKLGRCLSVFEGHRKDVWSVEWMHDLSRAVSFSWDRSARVWDLTNGLCLGVIDSDSEELRGVYLDSGGKRAFSGDRTGGVHLWNLSEFFPSGEEPEISAITSKRAPDQVQYTNAKVLLVGNSAAGKTGLSNRLALDNYKETDSTVGAWATQWKLPLPEDDDVSAASSGRRGQDAPDTKVEREVWLWDFGGQADQRLIHQLYMDHTHVAALVFDPQKDNVFETLGQWDRDLNRADRNKDEHDKMTKLLVAGRCDAGGLRVAKKQVEDFAAERGYAAYLETSAKTSDGCAELKQAIIDGIKWENIPWRSSPVLFKRLKDEIIRLKDEGRVLMRFNELREMLALRMSGSEPKALASGDTTESVASAEPAASAVGSQERFTDAELKAVIGLLAGPGVVWELEFGSWVLLQPERINAYAQAVIATIREDEFDRGCILEERVLKGDLTYHSSIERLPADEEQFVLLAMHQILVERGLCYRHMTDEGQILLIFPSYYRRERPEMETAPAVQVSYEFNGFLDEIYATLVVKLHHTKEFDHDQLWRYAADFKTKDDRQLGVSLTRRAEGAGELDVYFAPDVPVGERIIFSKYIHEHLLHGANDVVRLRHYICPHCGTPVGNRQVAMRKLEEGKKDIPCVECDDAKKRIPLWDELEELFADEKTKQRVQDLRDAVQIVLDTTSKERVLVGEVISTVALAGQLCEEFTVTDHGIDMEITFRNDAGEATGRKVYLQLKSGDSYLTTRKKDGAEIFKSFTRRHAEFWMDQKFPVILVIRNSKGEIRWMEIRDHLKKITNNGKKQVRQIEFDGRRFDVMSVRRWRDAALGL